METKVTIRSVPWGTTKDVFILRRGMGKVEVLHGDTFETVTEGAIEPKPTITLDDDMLQAFANELQAMNIKPKEASKTEGLLEAQSEHLKDLRKLLKL